MGQFALTPASTKKLAAFASAIGKPLASSESNKVDAHRRQTPNTTATYSNVDVKALHNLKRCRSQGIVDESTPARLSETTLRCAADCRPAHAELIVPYGVAFG